MPKEDRYFIVRKDDIGDWENEDGLTEAEAIAELKILDIEDLENMAVVFGHRVQIHSVLQVSLKEE